MLFMRYLEVVKAIQDSKEFKTNKVLICTQLSAVLLVCVCVCVCVCARASCLCLHSYTAIFGSITVCIRVFFIYCCLSLSEGVWEVSGWFPSHTSIE